MPARGLTSRTLKALPGLGYNLTGAIAAFIIISNYVRRVLWPGVFFIDILVRRG